MTAADGGGPARALSHVPAARNAPTPHATAPTAHAAAPTAHATAPQSAQLPLRGKIVGIDPGHNGRNHTDLAHLAWQVWNGREWENCDTVGAETNGGYTEALFNFRVAEYLRAGLIRAGARVVMTRATNGGVGPCVDRRSSMINSGHPNVAVDIHADSAPSWGRGFAILQPVADGPNNKVIGSSARLGADVRAAMLTRTRMPVSNYDGRAGIKYRDDLAGLNLTKVPKILIEVGNMRNATDAAMLTSARFQQQVAGALLAAIVRFLR
jgi:N-acetylmuramoyl-L-alanine amidase